MTGFAQGMNMKNIHGIPVNIPQLVRRRAKTGMGGARIVKVPAHGAEAVPWIDPQANVFIRPDLGAKMIQLGGCIEINMIRMAQDFRHVLISEGRRINVDLFAEGFMAQAGLVKAAGCGAIQNLGHQGEQIHTGKGLGGQQDLTACFFLEMGNAIQIAPEGRDIGNIGRRIDGCIPRLGGH